MNSRAVSKDWSIQGNDGSCSRGRKADREVIFSFRGQSSGNNYNNLRTRFVTSNQIGSVNIIFTVDHTSDPE